MKFAQAPRIIPIFSDSLSVRLPVASRAGAHKRFDVSRQESRRINASTSPSLARWLLVAALGLVTGAPLAQAHDPFEVGVVARLSDENFVVRITLARSTALKLCGGATGGSRMFDHDQFEAMRPAFENCARNFVVLDQGNEKLAPRTAAATLTIDDDMEIEIMFPRPAAGPLHIDAAFMRILGEGYGGTLVVTDGDMVLCDERIQIEIGTDADVIVPAPRRP